jgi:hypothetical protein
MIGLTGGCITLLDACDEATGDVVRCVQKAAGVRTTQEQGNQGSNSSTSLLASLAQRIVCYRDGVLKALGGQSRTVDVMDGLLSKVRQQQRLATRQARKYQRVEVTLRVQRRPPAPNDVARV